MNKLLRLELSRAFCNKWFLFSLLIGCLLAVLFFIMEALPVAFGMDYYLEHFPPMSYPGCLYSYWLGGQVNTTWSYLFFILLPLLAVLPHADSFFLDAKGGFIQNLCIRSNSRKDYFKAKYLSAFISGGAAVVLPLLFSFFLAASVFPIMNPEPVTFTTAIGETSTFPYLYYYAPLLYLLLYLAIIFIFSGLLADLALLSSYYVNHRFLVLISSFIVYLFTMTIFSFASLKNWAPNNFLNPAYEGYTLYPLIVEAVFLFILTYFGFVIKSKKEDIY